MVPIKRIENSTLKKPLNKVKKYGLINKQWFPHPKITSPNKVKYLKKVYLNTPFNGKGKPYPIFGESSFMN